MHITTASKNISLKKLVRIKTLAVMLDMSRSGLSKLREKDPSFPKPIKDSDSRQSAVYFVVEEINDWISLKMESRFKEE